MPGDEIVGNPCRFADLLADLRLLGLLECLDQRGFGGAGDVDAERDALATRSAFSVTLTVLRRAFASYRACAWELSHGMNDPCKSDHGNSARATAVVLQVLPSLVTGGVERGTVEITQAIAEAGWTALVASAGGPLVRADRTRRRPPHHAAARCSRNPLAIWRNAARLAALIRAEHVAIVHARSRAPAWSAWLACRRTGAHFVTTYHGAYGEDLPFKRRYNAVMAQGRAA